MSEGMFLGGPHGPERSPAPPPPLKRTAADNLHKDHSAAHSTETTPLLRRSSTDGGDKDGATWQQETKRIVMWAMTFIITYLLQQSIYLVGIFAMDHVGTTELGAVSSKYPRPLRP